MAEQLSIPTPTPAAPPAAPPATPPAPEAKAPAQGETPPAAPPAPGAKSALGEPAADPKAPAADPAKKGEETPKDGAKGDEELKFTVPEGVKLNEAMVGEFKPLAKELGLKSESAQKLVDLIVKHQKADTERAQLEFKQQDEAWVKELKADADIGGAKWDESLGQARAFLTQFGGPKLMAKFDAYGIGNDPDFVRMAVMAGRKLADDTVARDRAQGGGRPVLTRQQEAAAYYEDMGPKK